MNNKTLHELSLKFVVKHITTGNIIACFVASGDAIHFLELLVKKGESNYQVKEVY